MADAVAAAVGGCQQARRLVAVEAAALGEFTAEHILELAEAAVTELLRQAREGRRIDPQLLGQLTDGRYRCTLRRLDQGSEHAARTAAEGNVGLPALDGLKQQFQASQGIWGVRHDSIHLKVSRDAPRWQAPILPSL
ncbi:hypothetical protein D9M70_546480 [compost metagenome]